MQQKSAEKWKDGGNARCRFRHNPPLWRIRHNCAQCLWRTCLLASRSETTIKIPVRPPPDPILDFPILDCRSLSRAILALFSDIRRSDREVFSCLYLNASKRVVESAQFHVGGTCFSIVDKKLFLRPAILTGASYAITVHNHPGGNMLPSSTDIQTFADLAKAAQSNDVRIIDHAIVVPSGVYSCREKRFTAFCRRCK